MNHILSTHFVVVVIIKY